MKAKELLEAPPVFNPAEANFGGLMQRFYSDETLKRDFEFAQKFKIENEEVFVVIAKDKSKAAIGFPSIRKSDNKSGMEVVGVVDFKKPDISASKWFDFKEHILQVDGVEVTNKFKTLGYGFHLYLGLAKAGFVIISDNYQYIGGKSLWKKIASQDKANDYAVYVIDNGNIISDDNGDPIKYNGANIDDANIWSKNDDKHFVVLTLKAIVKNEK